jgi:hypothetical protein
VIAPQGTCRQLFQMYILPLSSMDVISRSVTAYSFFRREISCPLVGLCGLATVEGCFYKPVIIHFLSVHVPIFYVLEQTPSHSKERRSPSFVAHD